MKRIKKKYNIPSRKKTLADAKPDWVFTKDGWQKVHKIKLSNGGWMYKEFQK